MEWKFIQYHEQVKEDGTIVNVPHPITYQSCTFQGYQKNWSAPTKDAYAIYMSFSQNGVLFKDAHIKIKCDHAPLHKFMYSVTKNGKVNNRSQEIHAITPYIDLEHIKGKTMF